MTTVLVADNLDTALLSLSQEVRRGGYTVVTATNPEQAITILNSGDVDVGVIDLRLTNDSKHDISGIKVAKESDRKIPKIIVSSFDSVVAASEVLGTSVEGLPATVEFVKKDKVSTELLPAIARALKIKHVWSTSAQNRISEQLNQDYMKARRAAIMHYWASLVISIAFAVPIVYGAFLLHGDGNGSLSIIFTVIGVLVAEVTNYLFAAKLEFLYERVDRFHSELLQANRFEQLLEASDHIRNEAEREQFKLKVLGIAAARWLTSVEVETSDNRLAELRQNKYSPVELVGEENVAPLVNRRQ